MITKAERCHVLEMRPASMPAVNRIEVGQSARTTTSGQLTAFDPGALVEVPSFDDDSGFALVEDPSGRIDELPIHQIQPVKRVGS